MDLTHLANLETWARLALLLSLGAAVYFSALSAFTLHRLRHPRRRSYAYAVARSIPGDPSELPDNPPPYEEWSLEANGTRSAVWDVKADDPRGPTVIVTHGWGSSRIDMLCRFSALRPHASRVLFWDMRAHGDTPGACTLGAREPADLASLIETAPGDSVVLYGYSLGAEVTLKALASLTPEQRTRIGGVILEAPYRRGVTPARAVLDQSRFPSTINLPAALISNSLLSGSSPGERYRDLARFADAARGTPTLVIHGGLDTISPLGDGEAIAHAAGGSITTIPDAGHKDLYEHGRAVPRPAISAALSGFFAGRGPASGEN